MIVSVLDVLDHPAGFGPFFEGPSWDRWRAVLKAAFALPMSRRDLRLFKEVAGDRKPPKRPVRELVCCIGRGGGKDSIASALATYIATNSDFSRLRPGERGSVLCLANGRQQAGIAFRYILGYFEHVPRLAGLMARPPTNQRLELTNGAEIIIGTNSHRMPRGLTLACSIYDECATWRSEESVSPDFEVDAAVTPGLARFPGSLKIIISSVYTKTGLLYDKYRTYFGKNDDETLVVLGTTRQFNQNFDQKLIERELEKDYEVAAAEYLSIWRTDVSAFLSREAIAACVVPGRRELPPLPGVRYFCFVDPSGGSVDSMTMAIAHKSGDVAILDCIRERKAPFSPEAVVAEFCALMKTYGLHSCVGDRWGGEFCREPFRKLGVAYNLSDRPASEIYRDSIASINSGKVEILA